MSGSRRAMLLALALDLLGEPPARVHPVVWMGNFLKAARKRWRAQTPSEQLREGAAWWALGAAAWAGAGALAQRLPGGWVTQGILLKPLLARRALFAAVDEVHTALIANNLPEARRLLAWHLVSRETAELTAPEVAGAAIESLAENLSDSVVAPLLCFRVGGLPLAALYRHANTADAMWGYRTPELEHAGKVAAHADDALNLAPARLTTLCTVLAAGGRGLKVWARDRRTTASPNAGHPMSAFAGALGVRLDKRGVYVLNAGGRLPQPQTCPARWRWPATPSRWQHSSGCCPGKNMPELPPLLPRVQHGGTDSQAFTGPDFSVNANPYGPNPALLRALREADHTHYPDPTYRAVRERLAAWHGVSLSEVALAVGASELLHRIVRAFLPPGGTLLSVHAPFGELSRAATLSRARVRVVTPETVLSEIRPGVSLVYIGHPHNPTGHRHSDQELEALAAACQNAGALLIVDEAYAPFLMSRSLPASRRPPTASLIRVLSPGKAHGLVGARPAYALAAPETVERLDNLAPAWHVPAGTAAVLAALPEAGEFLDSTLPQVSREAGALAAALRPLGAVEHHGTPYLTLEVGNAATVAADLLERGIKVRDCTSYGLPDRIRISTRRPEENARLIQTLRAVLEDIHG